MIPFLTSVLLCRNARGFIAPDPPDFSDLFAHNASSIMSAASSTPGRSAPQIESRHAAPVLPKPPGNIEGTKARTAEGSRDDNPVACVHVPSGQGAVARNRLNDGVGRKSPDAVGYPVTLVDSEPVAVAVGERQEEESHVRGSCPGTPSMVSVTSSAVKRKRDSDDDGGEDGREWSRARTAAAEQTRCDVAKVSPIDLVCLSSSPWRSEICTVVCFTGVGNILKPVAAATWPG